MKPVKFDEMNLTLTAPLPIKPLPVYRDDECIVSCWKLGFWERIKTLFSGTVWLVIRTYDTHPPLHLTIDTPFEKKTKTRVKKFWPLLILLIFCTQFTMVGQTMSQREWKESVGIISEMLIKEGMLEKDSNGVWYSNIKTPDELEALYEKYKFTYNEIHTYETQDVVLGSVYSLASGFGLGMLESHAFGYQYPTLNQDGWLQNYLTMNTSGDQFFKFHHPNKIGRELNDVFDRLAYKDLEKFYGSWLLAYAHHFVVKNTMATIYRGWAKYGKPFYYFNIEFDMSWFLERAFGIGE